MEVEVTVGGKVGGLRERGQLFDDVLIPATIPEVLYLLSERGVCIPVVTDGVCMVELMRGRLPCGLAGEVKKIFGLGVRPSFATCLEPVCNLLASTISVCPEDNEDKEKLTFLRRFSAFAWSFVGSLSFACSSSVGIVGHLCTNSP